MIIETSERPVTIELPAEIKKVGVMMSGGADSALLLYLYAKYMKEERNDISIIPVIIDTWERPNYVTFPEKIIAFVEKELSVKIQKMQVSDPVLLKDKLKTEKKLLKYCYESNIIECHVNGITNAPSIKELPYPYNMTLEYDPAKPMPMGQYWNRLRLSKKIKPEIKYENNQIFVTPIFNINKKSIVEIYKKFNLFETLWYLTSGCDNRTTYEEDPCKYCFFCYERNWATGSYK
jgi:tRNA(Ile)-lysidine synthase TilS/MesJ